MFTIPIILGIFLNLNTGVVSYDQFNSINQCDQAIYAARAEAEAAGIDFLSFCRIYEIDIEVI